MVADKRSSHSLVAERGSAAQLAVSNSPKKRPATENPSTKSKRQRSEAEKNQLFRECFGDDSSDDDVISLTNDTEFVNDISVTIDNVECTEIAPKSPSTLIITVDNSSTESSVSSSQISSTTITAPQTKFRIPRIAHKPSTSKSSEIHTNNSLTKSAFANQPKNQLPQQPRYQSSADRQRVEARREEFARKHEQERRKERSNLLKKIDNYQSQIDELNKVIERDYRNNKQQHISLEQYRERCVSLPIRHTAAPNDLQTYSELRKEASCNFSPTALRSNQPNWSVEPLVEEYVPTPINCPTSSSHESISFMSTWPSVQSARNAINNSTDETVGARHCEHSSRATPPVQIVSQERPNHSNRPQLVTHTQSTSSNDKLAIGQSPSLSGKSHVDSVYSRLGKPVENNQGVPSNSLITISRAEYDQLTANPKPKKKKLGKSQRMRIRKAKERDYLEELDDSKDH